jgi:hypothetical protein
MRGEDSNGDGITDDNNMNTYDNPGWEGWCIPSKEFDNELNLGGLKAAVAVASALGKPADSTKYLGYYNQASASFERSNSSGGFWDSSRASTTGKRGYYTGSSNVSGKGQAVWDGALCGQWFADLCGIGPLHPEGRIQSTLKVINDACLDQRNPPSYALMMAYPDVNCTGATPTGSYFNGSGNYVTYSAYPAGDLCAAFGHNNADVGMRCLHAFWNVTYSKFKRVYNVPCKFAIAGNGADWGINRYMNPPAAFGGLFGITGFSIDINAKVLRLKPSLPTSAQYRMDSLVAGPLMNPISCGTLDYRKDPATNGQRLFVKFDNSMQFNRIFVKKLGSQKVTVTKQGAGVPATIAVNPADTSEYMIAFASTLAIDNGGVSIFVGDYPVSARYSAPAMLKPVEFTVAMNGGIISLSYYLQVPGKVKISLVNSQGKSVRIPVGAEGESTGSHVVRHDWKNEPAGVYYARLSAGDFCSTKKLINVR